MKKVGIITLNDNNNYGNRLQNYAVQTVLKNLDVDCETIVNIANIKSLKFRIKHILKSILKKRYKCFLSFNKNIIKSKKIIDNSKVKEEIKGLDALYDCFIVGSDQVWNPTLKRFSVGELLPFADSQKRISFSASFGIEELPSQYKQIFKEELSKFKNISVREDAGKKIVEELTGRTDVEVLVDPTMLLNSDEWDKVAKKPKQLKKNQRYILNYFLGELSKQREEEISRIAKELNCDVINILDNDSDFYSTGPSEFLYLEKNAELICTDSFHSSVFSIIYNRPFLVFEREGDFTKMNSRIETLLSKFELEDRIYNGKITKEDLNVNYENAYKILEEEKKRSYEYLKKALELN